MPNREHLNILAQGTQAWNTWRARNSTTWADLHAADLKARDLGGIDFTLTVLVGANLDKANLQRANLSSANLDNSSLNSANLASATLARCTLRSATLNGADLSGAFLQEANFSKAVLRHAKLTKAILIGADLREADLEYTQLSGANLTWANLGRTSLAASDLRGASLMGARLVETNLERANLSGCLVYGMSAWNLRLVDTTQSDLVITDFNEPTITIDSLEVAQFLYLLLNNDRIRSVIDTIISKTVLILGRFTSDRKVVLDALREALRRHDLVPVLFDFDKPSNRDTHETVTLLARLARFVIADITEPRSIPQELLAIVESLPSVPVQPLLQLGSEPWGMYDHIKRYPWVLPLYRYSCMPSLLGELEAMIVAPAEEKARELTGDLGSGVSDGKEARSAGIGGAQQ